MQIPYPNNTNDCSVTYQRTRTGPNHFIVYYKNAAQIRFTPKEVGRVFGVAKFTPWVNEARDWCKEMVDLYEKDSLSTLSSLGDDAVDADPTADTKMIVWMKKKKQ